MGEREELLATVATLYYKLDQSQTQIADRLGVSSSKISRLIKEARDRGIVEIQIRTSVPRDFLLEQTLIERFGIRDAYVLQSTPDASEARLLYATGELAAGFLHRVIPELPFHATIGVAWGTSVHATVSALPNHLAQHIDVVQLMGGVGALDVDGPDLARMVAAKLGGRHYDLHAPVLVESATVRDLFLAEPAVREGILRSQTVSLAITGIGTVQDSASSFLRVGLLTRSALAALRSQGVVGEMCGRFFDINGCDLEIEINRRIIGIELAALRQIPQVLAIARGVTKAQAILGALRGRYLGALATDDVTASRVLSIADADSPAPAQPS